MEEALLAIIARIDGEFDNEHLEMFGPLTADTIEDVRMLAKAGLELEEWILSQKQA